MKNDFNTEINNKVSDFAVKIRREFAQFKTIEECENNNAKFYDLIDGMFTYGFIDRNDYEYLINTILYNTNRFIQDKLRSQI